MVLLPEDLAPTERIEVTASHPDFVTGHEVVEFASSRTEAAD
jgi:hypothetical protein